MARIFTSTVKGFEGTVTFKESLMLPDAVAVRKAIDDVKKIREDALAAGLDVALEVRDVAYAPALCKCIASAQIVNFPEHPTLETWRFTPAREAGVFFEKLLGEMLAFYYGEREEANPNA